MNAQKSPMMDSGFARWDLMEHFGVAPDDANLQALKDAIETLPIDPYATDSGRYRRYARAMYLPWERRIVWMPQTATQSAEGAHGYYQGDNNPEYGEIVRHLPALSEEICNNPLLMKMLQFDFDQTFWSDDDLVWPIYIGVHFMRLGITDAEHEAVASPNALHQDGEPFVFVHLINRDNVVGGGNILATPPHRGKQPKDVPVEDIIADFQLDNPLESYGIVDKMVSHYVAPVRLGTEDRAGERATFIVDFVPMRHKIQSM